MLTVRWRSLVTTLIGAWPVWLAIGTVPAVCLIGKIMRRYLLIGPPYSAILYAGTILELLGLVLVAIGLSDLRRLFGRPSATTLVIGWFGQFVAAFRPPRAVEGRASATGTSSIRAAGRTIHGAGPGAPIEDRVQALELNVSALRDELDRGVQQLRGDLDVVNEALQRENQERRTGEAEVKRKLEEMAVGDLHLEAVGLFWVFLGVLGTSIPEEIATIAPWLR
jgi:hypothetical protein